VDGLDLVSGVRAAISRSQEGCKRLAQLVKNAKKMFGHNTTKDVLGEGGLLILEQIETAMNVTLAKSAKLVDALEQGKKNKAKSLLQKSAAAFLQIQSDKGDKTAVLRCISLRGRRRSRVSRRNGKLSSLELFGALEPHSQRQILPP
jgi:hypothetical protein